MKAGLRHRLTSFFVNEVAKPQEKDADHSLVRGGIIAAQLAILVQIGLSLFVSHDANLFLHLVFLGLMMLPYIFYLSREQGLAIEFFFLITNTYVFLVCQWSFQSTGISYFFFPILVQISLNHRKSEIIPFVIKLIVPIGSLLYCSYTVYFRANVALPLGVSELTVVWVNQILAMIYTGLLVYIKVSQDLQEHHKLEYMLEEKGKAEKSLLEQAEELNKVNEDLNQVVYQMSHSLRGPVASLSGLLRVIQNEQSFSDYKNYFDQFGHLIEKIDVFVTEVNNYHASQPSKKSELRAVCCDQLITEAREEGMRCNSDMGELIKFEANTQIPEGMQLPVLDIEIILFNLVQNAYRFHDRRKATPYVKVYLMVSNQQLIIKVRDNGLGIPEEGQTRIFERFFRTNYEFMTTGLGLNLVKRRVDALGGRINMVSELGVGSTFEVILPTFYEEITDGSSLHYHDIISR